MAFMEIQGWRGKGMDGANLMDEDKNRINTSTLELSKLKCLYGI
jgi:hypothetical protein